MAYDETVARRVRAAIASENDVEATVTELKGRGVEFVEGVSGQGFGLVTHFKMPGDVIVQLYQPHYSK